jgi:hypothetical protein
MNRNEVTLITFLDTDQGRLRLTRIFDTGQTEPLILMHEGRGIFAPAAIAYMC